MASHEKKPLKAENTLRCFREEGRVCAKILDGISELNIALGPSIVIAYL